MFHPAFGYFADAYGLTQVAIEVDGKEPSSRQVAEIIAEARAAGARVIFVQPQFARASAEVIAREVGAQVVPLDPLPEDLPGSLMEMAVAIRSARGRGWPGVSWPASTAADTGHQIVMHRSPTRSRCRACSRSADRWDAGRTVAGIRWRGSAMLAGGVTNSARPEEANGGDSQRAGDGRPCRSDDSAALLDGRHGAGRESSPTVSSRGARQALQGPPRRRSAGPPRIIGAAPLFHSHLGDGPTVSARTCGPNYP